jgi:GWxTD domain-containing protein
LFILPHAVWSQERMPGGNMQARFSPISFEAVPLFGTDTSKAYVNIHYRIANSFFIFVNPGDPAAPRDELRARGQLLVELFDSLNVSVARDIRPIALIRTAAMAANEQFGEGDVEGATALVMPANKQLGGGNVEGAMSFAIPAGVYQIVFEVDDLESGRSSIDKNRTLTAHKVALKSLDLSPPFFAATDTIQHPGIRYVAFNHSTNVMFGGPRGGLVSQIYCQQCDSGLTVQWTLHGETDSRTPRIVELKGTKFDLTTGQLTLAAKEGPVVYDPRPSSPVWKALYVPLPLERLEPGHYSVQLRATDGKEKFSHELSFQVTWPGRPMSLMDWDIATDALRYIATPEEIDKILSAPTEQGQQLFQAFWRKRDPDTTTAYNEIMVEYYRRVDAATTRFSTSKEGDGYRTDRGRIYILFGPPTNTQRSLLPGQPVREIWTYNSVKKRFIFVDKNKSGNFILAESNNL